MTYSSENDLTESYSESIHEENYQQPKSSWDEPIENNLISRMTSNPPLHPKAANGTFWYFQAVCKMTRFLDSDLPKKNCQIRIKQSE